MGGGGYPGPAPALTHSEAAQPITPPIPSHPVSPKSTYDREPRGCRTGGSPHPGCSAQRAEGRGLGGAHSPPSGASSWKHPKDSVGGGRPERRARRGRRSPRSPSPSKHRSESRNLAIPFVSRQPNFSDLPSPPGQGGPARCQSDRRTGGWGKCPPAGRRKSRPHAVSPMERPLLSLLWFGPPTAFGVLRSAECTEVDGFSPIPRATTRTLREGYGK